MVDDDDMHSDMQDVGVSYGTRQSQSNWIRCIIWQTDTDEPLQCPVNCKWCGAGAGYQPFAEIFQSFRQLIPSHCGPSWLMRAVACATLPAHNAKWHKSCRLLFYPLELQIVCARKSWIAFGAGKHLRYIAAHELAAALGGDKAKSTRCLPCLCRMWYNVILCSSESPPGKHGVIFLRLNASLKVYSHQLNCPKAVLLQLSILLCCDIWPNKHQWVCELHS